VTTAPLRVTLAAASVGGVLGSLARFGITDAVGVTLGFPWSVFAINVVGSAALAGLPALAVVRRTPWVGVFLGTGVLGGFTTMSTASAQTVVLLEHGRNTTAIGYVGGTLVAALAAVQLVSRFVDADARAAAEQDEADE
jgi:fluoride exporter